MNNNTNNKNNSYKNNDYNNNVDSPCIQFNIGLMHAQETCDKQQAELNALHQTVDFKQKEVSTRELELSEKLKEIDELRRSMRCRVMLILTNTSNMKFMLYMFLIICHI